MPATRCCCSSGCGPSTERDGVELEHRPAALFQVRDGKICRTRFYLVREPRTRPPGWSLPARRAEPRRLKKKKRRRATIERT